MRVVRLPHPRAARATIRDYVPPAFCDGCGTIFPWAAPPQRRRDLQNLVDEMVLTQAMSPSCRTSAELGAGDVDAHAQWLRVLQLAPELWRSQRVQPVLATLVPARVKAQRRPAA